MNIYDLTQGKYPNVYDRDCYKYEEHINNFLFPSLEFKELSINPTHDWRKIPIFLVESSMANKYIEIPQSDIKIRVPEDIEISPNKDFNIDEWISSKERYNKQDESCKKDTQRFTVNDLLGVYVYNPHTNFVPRRIFIWMDKIKNYTEKNTTIQSDNETKDNEIKNNAQALFDLVLYHEMSHAIMDVELYGMCHSPKFSYAKDYPYRFIEEAYANGIALSILMNNSNWSDSTKSFIENFVKTQSNGYPYGWELRRLLVSRKKIAQWMLMKVLFNYDVMHLIKKFWEHKRFNILFKFAETVGHNGWIAIKGHTDQWQIIEIPLQNKVSGFKEYDYFWSFDKKGLCRVRLNQMHGYLYGYVNLNGEEQIPVEYDHIYSFENGITVAKRDGQYGIIDINNNIIVPFGLPYEEVRGFRNGRASVKNSSDKWGVIDTNGNLIVPCENERIVS